MKKILLLLLIFVSGCTGVVAQQQWNVFLIVVKKVCQGVILQFVEVHQESHCGVSPVGHCSPADHGTLRPDTYGTTCGTYQRG